MAVSIAKLRAQLILDTENWLNGFKKAETAAITFGGVTSKLGKFFGGFGGQIAAATIGTVGLGSAIAGVSQSMNQIDREAKLADRLGITVGEVQKLSLAADLAGTDVELLAKSMLKMGKNIGSGGQSLDKRLFQVADSIAQIKDAGKRAAKAEEIFGKGGLELINVLTQGGRGIRESASAIDRFGLAISRIDAAKVEAANDAWTVMKTALRGISNTVAIELSPQITDFISTWLDGVDSLIRAHENLKYSMRDAGEEGTRWYDTIIAGIARVGDITAFGANSAVSQSSVAEIKEGLRQMRMDAVKSAALGGRNTGAGLLGRAALGGASSHAANSGMFERGSLGAAEAISRAGGTSNPMVEIEKTLKEMLLIEKNEAIRREREARQKGVTIKASEM